jgi:nitrogen regulatory protein PII
MPVKTDSQYKLITCILPNDGSNRKLMRALRNELKINTANNVSCYGLEVLADADTKYGELPEPVLVRKVDVVVPAAEADALFDYIYEKADIGRVGGGSMWQGEVAAASEYILPEGVPDEKR